MAYPFKWNGSWASASLAYKHTNFSRASHDPQATLYWGRPVGKRWAVASTGVFWTQNRNHGDDFTASLRGKEGAFLVDTEKTFLAQGDLTKLFSDHVHPNDTGYGLIAQTFFEAIAHGKATPGSSALPELLRPPR